MAMARVRLLRGKRSDSIEIAAGVSAASPAPTPQRHQHIYQKEQGIPPSPVMKLHAANPHAIRHFRGHKSKAACWEKDCRYVETQVDAVSSKKNNKNNKTIINA